MFININSLPSHGLGYKVPAIEMRPLTYERICEYDEDKVENPTPIHHLMKDVHYFLSDIDGYKDFLLFDLQSLIFSRKIATLIRDNKKPISTIIYDEDNKAHKVNFLVSNIQFNDMDEGFSKMNYVTLSGRQFDMNPLATIGDLEENFKTIVSRNENPTIKVLYLLTILGFKDRPNEIKRVVSGAVYDDIMLLETLWNLVNGAVKPQKFIVYKKSPSSTNPEGEGRREIMVSLESLVSNFFRLILLNGRLDESSLGVRERVSS